MTSAIKELWYDNLSPGEHCAAGDTEIRHLVSLMEKNREKLCAVTTEAQQEIFEKYMDCADEYSLKLMEKAFCEGFCLGTRLTAEAFCAE